MDEIMDSDDQAMLAALMEEEAEIATADDEEHLMMMSCLICGCSKETLPSFIFCLLFIWISNYVLFVCINYAFKKLYGSSCAISNQLGAWRECHISKIKAESTHIWAALGFCGDVWGARLGNRRPHMETGAGAPHTTQKMLALDAVWEGEWRCSEGNVYLGPSDNNGS
jgi:hypothetical protein